MVQKWLGALDYELHMFYGNTQIVHHNRLKPYHGLKRPPGYYCAFAEAKRDGPQLQFAIESQGQRLSPVSQVGQLHRQREAPPQIESVCPELTGGVPPVIGPGVPMQDCCTHPCCWKMSQLQVC